MLVPGRFGRGYPDPAFPVGLGDALGGCSAWEKYDTDYEWVIIPAVDLGLACELAWFGDMPVNQQGGPLNGDVVGSYDNTAIHFIALSLQWNIGAKKDPDG